MREDITGLVLAGGRGSRMGGVDKGLQLYRGQPLVQHALARLAPQVGPMCLNANRYPEVYRQFGLPLLADGVAEYPGPLAGFLAGLTHCQTPWLLTVPCDTPDFPLDLARRLGDALLACNADIALAATLQQGRPQPQPVFCLMRSSLRASLVDFIASGQGKIDSWTAQHARVQVLFDDAQAFFNINTLAELQGPPAP